jgi:two-component system NtrC family sensor kinase
MTMSRSGRKAALAGGAAVLLGLLVFLFVKTQSADFKGDAQTLSLLREIKDVDTRWDMDGLRIADDLSLAPNPLPVADRSSMLARILRELQNGPVRPGLANDLSALRLGMEQKQAAFAALRAAHVRTLAALRTSAESLRTLAAAAAPARARDPRKAELVAGLSSRLAQIRAALAGADVGNLDEAVKALDMHVAVLRPEALAIEPALGDPAAAVEAAVREFIAARQAETAAWKRFAFMTVGARVDFMAQKLSKSIESALDETDRWRAYLFAYAAALLIVVAYLGLRVASAQMELRRVNEELEQRVSERTRDLTTTLKRLKESEAQLVQSEKMSSLGQMVAGVAHEINSPLAYVKNSVAAVRDRISDLQGTLREASELLAVLHSESPDHAELGRVLEALDGRIKRMRRDHVLEDFDTLTRDGLHGIEQINELVKNLRNFSRLDRSKVASFNVNEGVTATLLIAKPNLRNIDIVKDLGPVPSITCSPSQVNQVLLNLVTNSAQAMDKPEGRIVITTRPGESGWVTIDVEDNGKGIPAEAMPRIFDPFFTTKEVGKGTGLGLAIAYKIVTQHGGRIDVRSTVGTGTVVTVSLPVEPPAELAQTTAEEAKAA